MLDLQNEHILLELCMKHDSKAQKILYEKYFPKMMAVCLRYLKNEDDAWHVLNTAFLRVFSKIKQYKAEGSLEGWIKRIVINSSLDFIRSNTTYRKKFVLTNEFNTYGHPDEIERSTSDFLVASVNLSKEEIFELITELPPATRIVFNLFVIDDYSHKQIAERLKISTGTSQWHLSNARRLLKEKINSALSERNKNNDFIHGEAK